jgi:hypothetical protein
MHNSRSALLLFRALFNRTDVPMVRHCSSDFNIQDSYSALFTCLFQKVTGFYFSPFTEPHTVHHLLGLFKLQSVECGVSLTYLYTIYYYYVGHHV